MSVLDDENVRSMLRQAWVDSRPGTGHAHEEGGFVLRDADGCLSVERWVQGQRDCIVMPSHAGGVRSGKRIVATFHTHPNPGPDYQQEPSLTDIRAVRHDPDLRHPEYEGELVISADAVYQIHPDGTVESLGSSTTTLLDDV